MVGVIEVAAVRAPGRRLGATPKLAFFDSSVLQSLIHVIRLLFRDLIVVRQACVMTNIRSGDGLDS